MKLPTFEMLTARPPGAMVLPPPLAAAYGGKLDFPRDAVVANFVASADGVVALPSVRGESGGVISGGSGADRLLMGILRACTDAVLIGAGTLRAAPGDLWLPEAIFPRAAATFAALRKQLGLPPRPHLYVVSASGRVDLRQPAMKEATLLRGKLAPAEIIEAIRADGHRRILCEGGPSLFGELVAARELDGLFLTLSPRLFGRFPNDGRKSLAAGRDLGGAGLRLRSVRRSGAHLFLRYALAR